jgi:iron-sulfur cluster insertion protein
LIVTTLLPYIKGMSHIIHISDSAAARIAYLLGTEPEGSRLRVAVLGGGCSGFQYHFDFDADAPAEDDQIFEKSGASVIVDETSLEMLHESMVDYVETLGAAAFEIKNPQATANCGCGNSFAVA